MTPSLSVLLFGYGFEGLGALRGLHEAGHRVIGCLTHPAPEWLPDLEGDCQTLDIPCATNLDSDELAPSLVSRPDVVLSVGYRRKIEMPYLGLGTIGAFNIAMSQLPRYRGCFPYPWAILNDESMWGVTVHQMTSAYCEGAVLHRRSLATRPRENAYEFYRRCAQTSAKAAVEAVQMLAGGVYHLISVDPAGSQFFNGSRPYGGLIDWHQSAAKIDCFIRALDFGRETTTGHQHYSTPAQARLEGETIQIWRARFGGTMSVYPPGTITRCDSQVWVQAGRGHVVIEKIRSAGVDHDAADFFTTRGIQAGDAFDSDYSWTAGAAPARELSHAA